MVSGSPVGSTPFAMAAPVAAPAAATQGPALSRYINPCSGDYQIDSYVGQLAGMPTLRQRVLLILNTEYGSSSALPTLGIRRPAKITESFVAETRAAIRQAFYRLTDVERIMQIDNIFIIKQSGGRVEITIEYRDLTVLSPTPQLATRTI